MYCIALHCIALHCIVLYCIVLYCIVLYCIVLYCIVLYCIDICSPRSLFNLVFLSVVPWIISLRLSCESNCYDTKNSSKQRTLVRSSSHLV